MIHPSIAPQLTPRGHLLAVSNASALMLAPELAAELTQAFSSGAGGGLLYLGTALPGRALPPAWAWWREFAVRHVAAVCAAGEGGLETLAAPEAAELGDLIADAPPMIGAEYLDAPAPTGRRCAST